MTLRLLVMTMMSCTLFSGASYAQDAVDESEAEIKQRYLKTLTSPPDFDDPNYIGTNYRKFGSSYLFSFAGNQDLQEIIWSLRGETFSQDPDIQRALIAIRNFHPITTTRKIASHALDAKTPPAQTKIVVSGIKINGHKDLNKTRKYCSPESVGAKALPTAPEALVDELTPVYDYGIEGQDFKDKKVEGVDIFAKDVSGGWLTGYGKVPSLGLHYVPRDKSLKTSFLIGGTVHAIIEKEDSDSFLILSNASAIGVFWRGNTCPSLLEVSEVTETAEGEFEIKTLRRLPDRVENVAQMENGDLFVSFGTTCFSRGMESPSKGPFAQDQYYFNPPVGVTTTGHIYDVCEGNSSNRRW